jgi:hypothetical protein
MSIIGEPFAGYVNDQIKVRQDLMGKISDRGPEMLAWANAKTAWVKLASGVFLSGSYAEDRLKAIGLTPPSEYMGTNLAQQNVLFGGTSKYNTTNSTLQQRSTFKEVYDHTDTDFGLVPMPGIESIDIQDKNRGSIREANVQIKANSRRQLEIIDALYLRLGYTVFLEWGNSHYIDNDNNYKEMGSTLIKDFFKDPQTFPHPNTHRGFLGDIEGKRGDTNGNYDGFLGKVTNFTWNFEPDGTYKISLKIISLGSVIESLKVNLSPSKDDPFNTQNSGSIENNVISEYLDTYKLINSVNISPTPSNTCFIKYPAPPVPGGYTTPPNNGWIVDSSEVGIPTRTITRRFFNSTTTSASNFQLYVDLYNSEISEDPAIKLIQTSGGSLTWKIIQNSQSIANGDALDLPKSHKDLIDNYFSSKNGFQITLTVIIPSQTITTGLAFDDCAYFKIEDVEEETNPDTNSDINYYIKFSTFLEALNRLTLPIGNGDERIIDIKANGNTCYTIPNQISYDPRVCLIRNDVEYPAGSTIPKYDIASKLTNFFDIDKKVGKIDNIYLNHSKVKEIVNGEIDSEGKLTLWNVLTKFCEEISKALGGINNLEPHINEETNKVEIIDHSLPSSRINDPQTPFQIYGYNGTQSTFVRNATLQTKISPEFASMITIGATAAGYTKGMEATAFSKWSRGLVDRFQQEYSSPFTNETGSTQTPSNQPELHYMKMFTESDDYSDCGFIIDDKALGNISFDSARIDTNLSVATEYFKYLKAKSYESDNTGYSPTGNGFIPFNMQLTMDGISGIKIYNKIEVDARFLPFNYPQTIKYIVTKVNHKLSKGDWETSIETISMPGAFSP